MAGSGFGAFDIATPSQSMLAAAQAQSAVSRSALEAATLPDEIAMGGMKRDSSTLALADQRKTSVAKETATDESLIANAAALATDADTWDRAMQTLVDKGVDEARQYVGRFSTALQQRVSRAYSAASPPASLEAMQSDNPTGVGAAQSGLAGVGGNAGAGVSSGATPANYDQLFAKATPDQLKQAYDHLEKQRAAIAAVAHSSNPGAEWDKQAQALGQPDYVGKYSPEALQQLAQETIPADNYLRGRFLRQGAGVPQAGLPATIDNVGGTLYAVDRTDPAHPVAKPLTPQGKGVLVGTDPKTGVGIYYDPTTGKETRGSIPLGAKPGTTSQKPTTFALKQAAWLQAHPGDTQGALDYAGGLKGKNLSPEQIQMAATTAAGRELGDMAMAGTTPPDAQAFITERTKQIAADIAAAGTGGGPAASAAETAIPPRALAMLKDGLPHTFNNGTTWQLVDGKPKRIK